MQGIETVLVSPASTNLKKVLEVIEGHRGGEAGHAGGRTTDYPREIW